MVPRGEATLDDWRDELDLKFSSVLNTVEAALPLLRKSDAAAIVNISAVLARQPEPRLVTTSAARAGLLNLSKSLSLELAADGIRVNSVSLGLVDTGQWRRRYENPAPTPPSPNGRRRSPRTAASDSAGSAAPTRWRP